jgi:hypothetical protein
VTYDAKPKVASIGEPHAREPRLSVERSVEGSALGGVTHWYQTRALPSGTYNVVLARAAGSSGGDADLYVRVGEPPAANTFDCRPFTDTSDELCTIQVLEPARLWIAVAGYAPTASDYVLSVQGYGVTVPFAGSATIAANQDLRFTTEPLYAGDYVVTLTGAGNADLSVGLAAGGPAAYTCRPSLDTSDEECLVSVPYGGAIDVRVRGVARESRVALKIHQSEPPPRYFSRVTRSGVVTAGQVVTIGAHELPRSYNARFTVTLTGTGDADLYVWDALGGWIPIELSLTNPCRPYLATSEETCVVEYNRPPLPYGEDYQYGVAVHVRGYAPVSTFTVDVQFESASIPLSYYR